MRVPSEILTEEEAKVFSNEWQGIKKELDDWHVDELKKLQGTKNQ